MSALHHEEKKKAQMQVSQKVLVSFSQRIAEVTKAQRRELTWRAGPTPTALTTIHANILCFCWLGIVPFLYASAGMSTSYTTAVCDTFTNRATLPTDILCDFVWLAADRHFQNTLEIMQIAINQKKNLFF